MLEGELKVRHPDGEDVIGPGDVTAFPAGPEGAHKTTTNGDEPVRSSSSRPKDLPAVAYYPDSEQDRRLDRRPRHDVLVRRGEKLDYYDGET